MLRVLVNLCGTKYKSSTGSSQSHCNTMKTAKSSCDFFLLFLLFASFHTKNLRLFPFFCHFDGNANEVDFKKGAGPLENRCLIVLRDLYL